MPRSDGGSSDWSVVRPTSPDRRWGKARSGEEAATQTEEAPPSQSSCGAAASGSSGGFLAQARREAAKAARALRGWTLFVQAFRKIRKYQRYFHNTGERLKDFPKALRDKIAIAYPKRS